MSKFYLKSFHLMHLILRIISNKRINWIDRQSFTFNDVIDIRINFDRIQEICYSIKNELLTFFEQRYWCCCFFFYSSKQEQFDFHAFICACMNSKSIEFVERKHDLNAIQYFQKNNDVQKLTNKLMQTINETILTFTFKTKSSPYAKKWWFAELTNCAIFTRIEKTKSNLRNA